MKDLNSMSEYVEEVYISDNELDNETDDETINELSFNPEKFGDAVVWGTDWTTETVARQLSKGNIDLNPSFQRRDAWSNKEKSRLIESLMLGLPVPPIILAENKKKKNSYIVIDGKQRLLSIRKFFVDMEGEDDPDESQKFKKFTKLKLCGLDILKDLNGLTYKGVEKKNSEYITNLENQTIRTVVIKNWPDESFLYTVFLRLNTGSKKLSPQELRQALKPGKFLEYLDEATGESKPLRKMLKNKAADPRMKDIELALRFFAYKYYMNEYNGNLKVFLDETCDKLNNAWEEKQVEIEAVFKSFESSIENAYEIMGNNSPFSRYANGESNGKFNRSIFELFTFYFSMEPICEAVKKDKEDFLLKFSQMNDDQDFITAVSGSTKDIGNIITRFDAFYSVLMTLDSVKDKKISVPKFTLTESGNIEVQNILS